MALSFTEEQRRAMNAAAVEEFIARMANVLPAADYGFSPPYTFSPLWQPKRARRKG
jgi:hypothetical protein